MKKDTKNKNKNNSREKDKKTIKNNPKINGEKKTKEEKEKEKVLAILIIIFIVIVILLIISRFINGNNLNTGSKLVKELHNTLNTDDLTNCEGLFAYSDKELSYKDIKSETRLCLAYQKADIKNAEIEKLEGNDKNLCEKDGMIFKTDENSKECSISKIKKDVIDQKYQEIFGKEIENNENFRVDSFHICYLKDNNYYCGLSEEFSYTIGSDSYIYRIIERAEKKSDTIKIYDYFLKINGNKCYVNYTTQNRNENCTKAYTSEKDVNYDFLEKYGTKYEHTFKKGENNTYYWVSSKPVK